MDGGGMAAGRKNNVKGGGSYQNSRYIPMPLSALFYLMSAGFDALVYIFLGDGRARTILTHTVLISERRLIDPGFCWPAATAVVPGL